MAERIRVRCPCCGMMANKKNFQSTPYKVEVYLQTFGGKVPGAGPRKGKGKAPGLMEYRKITNTKAGKTIVQEVTYRIENLF